MEKEVYHWESRSSTAVSFLGSPVLDIQALGQKTATTQSNQHERGMLINKICAWPKDQEKSQSSTSALLQPNTTGESIGSTHTTTTANTTGESIGSTHTTAKHHRRELAPPIQQQPNRKPRLTPSCEVHSSGVLSGKYEWVGAVSLSMPGRVMLPTLLFPRVSRHPTGNCTFGPLCPKWSSVVEASYSRRLK